MMKIEIFITESDKVLVDRSFIVKDGNAPTEIDIQELVDTAVGYLKEDERNRQKEIAELADKVDLSPDDPAFRGGKSEGGDEPF